MFFNNNLKKYKKSLEEAIVFFQDEEVIHRYQEMVNLMAESNRQDVNYNILKHNGRWYALIDFWERDKSESERTLRELNSKLSGCDGSEKDILTKQIDDLIIRIEVDGDVANAMKEIAPMFDRISYMLKNIYAIRKKLNPSELASAKELEESLKSILEKGINNPENIKDFL